MGRGRQGGRAAVSTHRLQRCTAGAAGCACLPALPIPAPHLPPPSLPAAPPWRWDRPAGEWPGWAGLRDSGAAGLDSSRGNAACCAQQQPTAGAHGGQPTHKSKPAPTLAVDAHRLELGARRPERPGACVDAWLIARGAVEAHYPTGGCIREIRGAEHVRGQQPAATLAHVPAHDLQPGHEAAAVRLAGWGRAGAAARLGQQLPASPGPPCRSRWGPYRWPPCHRTIRQGHSGCTQS